MQQDTIFIIGAGAIGKVLAVFLKLEGKPVVLLRGSVHDGVRSSGKIEVELPGLSIVEAEIETATLRHFPALQGTIVFTNKSFANTRLAKAVRGKIGHSPIVILQNGLNVEQPFINEGYTAIYRSVLFATSQEVADDRFRFRPVVASPIGLVKGSAEKVEAIVATVNNRHFPFRTEARIEPLVWTKTIVNCVFNSVCPLLEIDNGIFYRNPAALEIAKNIIAECVSIAAASNILLREEEVLQTLLNISLLSEGQLISTYVDIVKKRETEIGSLNFAIADLAGKMEKEALVKGTRLLGELIRLKSEISRQTG